MNDSRACGPPLMTDRGFAPYIRAFGPDQRFAPLGGRAPPRGFAPRIGLRPDGGLRPPSICNKSSTCSSEKISNKFSAGPFPKKSFTKSTSMCSNVSSTRFSLVKKLTLSVIAFSKR